MPAKAGVVAVRRTDGNGRPVVLLHGLLDSSSGWREYCKQTHRPCYAIDLPGFGHSAPPREGTTQAYATAVLDVLRHYNLNEVTLVGHSLGGAVAAAVAAADRDTIHSLVLIEAAGFGRISLAEWFHRLPGRHVVIQALPFVLANPLAANLVYALGVSGGHLAPPSVTMRLMADALRGTKGADLALEALADMSRDIAENGVPRSLYDGPVTALFGQRDRLVPKSHQTGVRSAFPRAHVEVWERLAHHPQEEDPARLDRFIERACARARRERRERRAARRRSAHLPLAYASDPHIPQEIRAAG